MSIAGDVLSLASAAVGRRAQLAAEDLFLRTQLARCLERQASHTALTMPTRIAVVMRRSRR
jgi:hypothetical protein